MYLYYLFIFNNSQSVSGYPVHYFLFFIIFEHYLYFTLVYFTVHIQLYVDFNHTPVPAPDTCSHQNKYTITAAKKKQQQLFLLQIFSPPNQSNLQP